MVWTAKRKTTRCCCFLFLGGVPLKDKHNTSGLEQTHESRTSGALPKSPPLAPPAKGLELEPPELPWRNVKVGAGPGEVGGFCWLLDFKKRSRNVPSLHLEDQASETVPCFWERGSERRPQALQRLPAEESAGARELGMKASARTPPGSHSRGPNRPKNGGVLGGVAGTYSG